MSAAKATSKRTRRATEDGTPEAVQAAFVPCGRCSFFLSAYRLIHDDFEQAVADSQDGQLRLTGGWETRRLLHKSFGVRVDVETQHYETLCHECQRRYVYEIVTGEEQSAGQEWLWVAVEPGQ